MRTQKESTIRFMRQPEEPAGIALLIRVRHKFSFLESYFFLILVKPFFLDLDIWLN